MIQFTKNGDVWQVVELPDDDQGTCKVAGSIVAVTDEEGNPVLGSDMKDYLAVPVDADMASITEIPVADTSLGSPIKVTRSDGKIVLSQAEEALFDMPVTITRKSLAEAAKVVGLKTAICLITSDYTGLQAYCSDSGEYTRTRVSILP